MFSKNAKNTSKPKTASVPIYFHNTLSGENEIFTPLKSGVVKMYNCGPTVYSYAHIGNLRSYVFADALKRTLKANGFRVQQIINITDVGHLTGENAGDADAGEDKMSLALHEEGLSISIENMQKIGERYTQVFKENLAELNVDIDNTVFPKASEHITGQIALIKTLEEKGYTYQTSDGVYFDTSRFSQYGKLGNIDVEKQKEGARVAVNQEKRNPADFALWKFNQELGWESPWGSGFPGWHIECSAMAYELLGKQIDIHTGGVDHIPTHHNNEIAQTESATGKPFANYWLHNEHLTIENRKVSKSIGNTVYLYHITDRGYSPLAYRYWLLTGHYRTPLNFTWEAIDGAHTAHRRLLRYVVEELNEENGGTVDSTYQQRFLERINDDLDTPGAIALLWELVKDEQISPADTYATLLFFDSVLGLGMTDARKRFAENSRSVAISDVPESIQTLVEEREEARKNKDFAAADELRKQIEEHGFSVADTSEGPELTRNQNA